MSSRTAERQLGECALQTAAVMERCDYDAGGDHGDTDGHGDDVDVGPDGHNAKEYVQISHTLSLSLSLFFAMPSLCLHHLRHVPAGTWTFTATASLKLRLCGPVRFTAFDTHTRSGQARDV